MLLDSLGFGASGEDARMVEPVVAAAARTPFGLGHGQLADRHPADLLAIVLADVVRALDRPIDAVLVGCASPVGAQGDNVGRAALLAAGGDETIGVSTIVNHGASSLVAVAHAAALIRAGLASVVIAAGVEVMSLVPMGASAMARHAYGKPWGDRVAARYAAAGGLLPEGARVDALGIDRGRADDWSRASIERFSAGRERLVAVGSAVVDERRIIEDDFESYPPLFDAGGAVTAANSAPLGDGAAAVVLAAEGAVAEPLARVVRAGWVGRSPRAADPPLVAALSRALGTADPRGVGFYEIHEGYAASVLATVDALGLPEERVNRRGGALAIGHPLGASGLRLATAAIDQLREAGHGLAAAAIDGEDGAAAVLFER